MREGNIGKEYVAVCHHRPRSDEGTIRLMLERNHEQKTGTKMRVGEEGLYSETSFRIEEYRNDLSRLELSLKTGRTHQIRVHLAHEGAPVVGDARYGDSVLDAALFDRTGLPERLYLHARKLTFRHPDTGKKVSLQAPVPSEFYRILDSA
jgi:23S rRNA-/tRNA-specific pseudouridylate synthase